MHHIYIHTTCLLSVGGKSPGIDRSYHMSVCLSVCPFVCHFILNKSRARTETTPPENHLGGSPARRSAAAATPSVIPALFSATSIRSRQSERLSQLIPSFLLFFTPESRDQDYYYQIRTRLAKGSVEKK